MSIHEQSKDGKLFSQQLVGGVVEHQPEIHGISQLFGWLVEKPSLDRSEVSMETSPFFFFGGWIQVDAKMLLVTVIVIGFSLMIS